MHARVLRYFKACHRSSVVAHAHGRSRVCMGGAVSSLGRKPLIPACGFERAIA